MKNIIIYYTAVLLPLPLLFWLSWTGLSVWFFVLLLFYAFPYRITIDGARLVSKKRMKWNEVWKLLLPGKRLEYTRDLYFKK